MSVAKIFSVMFAVALLSGAGVEAASAQEAPTVSDGWHTTDDTPSTSPKPSCGRMPRDGEYVPLFRSENGVYVECRWSYQGPKVRRPPLIAIDPLGSLARALEGERYYNSYGGGGYGSGGSYSPGQYNCPRPRYGESSHPRCGYVPPQPYRRQY